MFARPAVVRRIASIAAGAADRAIEDFEGGSVGEEPQVTERMLGRVSEALNGQITDAIRWEARSFRTGRGIAAEEKRLGADFMGTLTVELRNLSLKKGFLVQAKRAEPGQLLSKGDWGRLRDQCDKMLAISPASFVCAYSKKKGVFFFPAIEVVSAEGRDLFEHYGRGFQSFFELFLQCLIGDRRLHMASDELVAGQHESPAEQLLEVAAVSRFA